MLVSRKIHCVPHSVPNPTSDLSCAPTPRPIMPFMAVSVAFHSAQLPSCPSCQHHHGTTCTCTHTRTDSTSPIFNISCLSSHPPPFCHSSPTSPHDCQASSEEQRRGQRRGGGGSRTQTQLSRRSPRISLRLHLRPPLCPLSPRPRRLPLSRLIQSARAGGSAALHPQRRQTPPPPQIQLLPMRNWSSGSNRALTPLCLRLHPRPRLPPLPPLRHPNQR